MAQPLTGKAPIASETAPPSQRRLVFLPGLANDAEVWTEVRSSARAELERPNASAPLRWLFEGAAVSDVHTRGGGLPEMAERLLAETEGTLILVGHSMGGMIAQHAARQQPARVAGLALLATTARADTPQMIELRTEACAQFAAGRVDEVLQANVAFAFHPRHVADAALIARYFGIVQRAGAAQLIAQNQAVMARDDGRPHLAAIRCPTLVLAGEADALTPPEVVRELAEGVVGAEFQIVAGAGHMLTLEQPAEVAARLLRWLVRFF
jgi:pimeloyl-ACP methyl ester carboxylesterase